MLDYFLQALLLFAVPKLEDVLRHAPSELPVLFRVGVVDGIHKSIAHRILGPALQMPEPVRMICHESNFNNLLAELAVHRLDLVLADCTIPPTVSTRGFSHKLGESTISFFATKKLEKRLCSDIPQCLNRAPMLLPTNGNQLRSDINQWLDKCRVHPRIVAEFDDSALMKAFGQKGAGVFVAPSVIEAEVEKQYEVIAIGQCAEVKQCFYAISVERQVTNPIISVILEAARQTLFTQES